MMVKYATFARLCVNQETYLASLRKTISEIYGVEDGEIAVNFRDDSKYGVRLYDLEFPETVKTQPENLERLRARERAVMDALSIEAMKKKK